MSGRSAHLDSPSWPAHAATPAAPARPGRPATPPPTPDGPQGLLAGQHHDTRLRIRRLGKADKPGPTSTAPPTSTRLPFTVNNDQSAEEAEQVFEKRAGLFSAEPGTSTTAPLFMLDTEDAQEVAEVFTAAPAATTLVDSSRKLPKAGPRRAFRQRRRNAEEPLYYDDDFLFTRRPFFPPKRRLPTRWTRLRRADVQLTVCCFQAGRATSTTSWTTASRCSAGRPSGASR